MHKYIRILEVLQDQILSPLQVFHKAKYILEDFKVPVKEKKPRQVGELDIDAPLFWGFISRGLPRQQPRCLCSGGVTI